MGKDKLGGGLVEQPGMIFQHFDTKSRLKEELLHLVQIRSLGKTALHRPFSGPVRCVAGSGIDVGQ